MDFRHSDRSLQLQDQVRAFLDEHVYPAEHEFEQQVQANRAAGEPFRIVTGGLPALEGRTVLERRRWAAGHLDDVRRLLVNEPRGHADMYGAFLTPPDDEGADLGVVFFHNEGYSTACGHGTIALVTWALDEGLVERRDGETRVVVDVPSGWLETWARVEDGRVRLAS